MSDLKHMHAKTECLPFNTEDVRLVITERYGKQEIRMHGEDARFIVEAIAAAKRSSQPEAVDGDPIGDLQAEARQAKLDDFIASMKNQPEATAPAPIPGLPFADLATPIKEFEARKAAALASSANALSAEDRADAVLQQAGDALSAMLRQFTRGPSTLQDSKVRGMAHDALHAIAEIRTTHPK